MIKINKSPDAEYSLAIKKPIPIKVWQIYEDFSVATMEGTMYGKKGDYLLQGVAGELYPCDKDIFEHTYNLISPQAAVYDQDPKKNFFDRRH